MNLNPSQHLNPYDVLDISPDASMKEIPQAFAKAMKRRKYPVDAIAKARKQMMNPKERIIADYLRPLLRVGEFQRLDEESTTEEFEQFEAVLVDTEQLSEIDSRVLLTLTNFLD
ncbi:MAG: molecular chaperone DnaJ [Nostocaceae cyanobacterium]|nr:molecular chaperone DnaJ [Nostocaceae cyanobacterium]